VSEQNEIVVIDLTPADRLRLDQQINDRMAKLGYDRYGYHNLGLGFWLPISWPTDKDSELNLAQLTVLARKLGMRILVTNLEMIDHGEVSG